ncbi:MAG TPA: XRE family transcriptional regulator [Geobacteraceae bacterium]|nr:XRE family transcriptional regulator [Geobacteraceae bacterium]
MQIISTKMNGVRLKNRRRKTYLKPNDRNRERQGNPFPEMSLSELRITANLSQQNLAASMNKKQPNLSKIERSTDMYVSTLCDFVRAVGGELEIIVRLPDGQVRINQFDQI